MSRELMAFELFERSSEGIFRTALDGTILMANPALAKMAGFDSVDRLLDEVPNVMALYRDPARRAELVREILEQGSVDGFEIEMRRRDGSPVWISVNAAAVRDASGHVVGLEGTATDVTDRRVLERERSRLTSELIRALELERASIANDVHDDPVQVMTAVGLRLHALRRTIDDPKLAEAVDQLERSVAEAIGRLRRLIFDLHPSSLDRAGIATALREALAAVAEEADVSVDLQDTLEAEPDPETRALVFRIVQEALANVRKHASAQRISVVLANENGGIRALVRDDGVGFDPKAAPSPAPGHLGLDAMRERARIAGGWWRVHSTPGRGTEVECWIPFRAAVE
jgi:PAS domain S-box-containing protein